MVFVQQKLKKLVVIALAGMMAAAPSAGLAVSADEHYDVYNYDRWNEAIPSQAGYLASHSVSGRELGIGEFSAPSDIFRDAYDQFFIVDTGNDRIVVTNSELTEVVKVLEEFTLPDGSATTLSEPEGIYVSPETDLIYIADYKNSRVLVCDFDGNVTLEITKPESELFSSELTFLPQRVLADKAGNVYIVLGNITTGAAMFNSDGEFQGYYGANTVEATSQVIVNYFWKLISTEKMRSKTARSVPTGITSFDLDDEGFIYTCTQSTSQKTDTVKKLNPAGKNLFSNLGVTWGDFESLYDVNTARSYQSMICDIEVADDGNINCLDLTSGRVFQYDKEGNLLFIFGSSSEQLGGFTQVSAIESIGSRVLVTDSTKNYITVFEETDFGSIVHEATNLYNAGYYEEALEPWYKVLQYDGNYRRAFLGISAALLVEGDYEGSMKYAKLADSPYRYNRAFEGWRTEFLSEHMTEITVILCVLAAGGAGIWFYLKKRRKSTNNGKEAEKV